MFELGRERKKFLKTGNKINTVAYLALSQGGYEIFEKGHRRKMMKFLIIVYFHNSVALWIIRAFPYIYMVFTNEVLFEVVTQSWSE